MNLISDLMNQINARLVATTTFQATGTTVAPAIINEDAHDLETLIETKLGELGLLILIGMPSLKNLEPEKFPANTSIEFEIGVGENVLLNRDAESVENTKIPGSDAAQIVFQRLHGFHPTGWRMLQVIASEYIPDKTRQVHRLTLRADFILEPL